MRNFETASKGPASTKVSLSNSQSLEREKERERCLALCHSRFVLLSPKIHGFFFAVEKTGSASLNSPFSLPVFFERGLLRQCFGFGTMLSLCVGTLSTVFLSCTGNVPNGLSFRTKVHRVVSTACERFFGVECPTLRRSRVFKNVKAKSKGSLFGKESNLWKRVKSLEKSQIFGKAPGRLRSATWSPPASQKSVSMFQNLDCKYDGEFQQSARKLERSRAGISTTRSIKDTLDSRERERESLSWHSFPNFVLRFEMSL